MVRREPWFLVHHRVPAREHRWFIVPCFIVVHAGFFVQFLGVEGIFGQSAVLPQGGVFRGDFAKGSIQEALGYRGVVAVVGKVQAVVAVGFQVGRAVEQVILRIGCLGLHLALAQRTVDGKG